GLVKQPMVYTLDALHRYPMVSRISFVECGGNSAPLYSKEPIQANAQALHGLCSGAEWTRRKAHHRALGSERPSDDEVVHRRRRGPADYEPEHSAREGDG